MRAKKIHLLDIHRDPVALPNEYLGTGCGAWAYGWQMVREHVFRKLPRMAQCQRCDRGLYVHSEATLDQMISIEVALIAITRAFAGLVPAYCKDCGEQLTTREVSQDFETCGSCASMRRAVRVGLVKYEASR